MELEHGVLANVSIQINEKPVAVTFPIPFSPVLREDPPSSSSSTGKEREAVPEADTERSVSFIGTDASEAEAWDAEANAQKEEIEALAKEMERLDNQASAKVNERVASTSTLQKQETLRETETDEGQARAEMMAELQEKMDNRESRPGQPWRGEKAMGLRQRIGALEKVVERDQGHGGRFDVALQVELQQIEKDKKMQEQRDADKHQGVMLYSRANLRSTSVVRR